MFRVGIGMGMGWDEDRDKMAWDGFGSRMCVS